MKRHLPRYGLVIHQTKEHVWRGLSVAFSEEARDVVHDGLWYSRSVEDTLGNHLYALAKRKDGRK